ncbi:MAG: sulfatase-like hydrolase/transferase [Saprospiraceae bacterium]|nr:sulfatase-like hydrolase/transferase [Saprospiraceae bacterium]
MTKRKFFIESSLEEDKPFFAYISTNTPHAPYVAKEEDLNVLEGLYEESTFPGKNENLKKTLVPYLAMVRNIDTNVGSLLGFLDKNGVRNNTIVIFLTDNGTIMGTKYFNAGMGNEN